VPETFDGGHLGEEPMPADVEAPAVALGGPADAADHVVRLKDGDLAVGLGQLVCRGEAGRPAPDDRDG